MGCMSRLLRSLLLLPALPLAMTSPLDPPGCLARVSLGCPCLVVRHTLGGCLPPSPLIVALKRGASPPMTLHPLSQEVEARNAKMPLAAGQEVMARKAKMPLVAIEVDHQGRPWVTCELALAAWCLRHITPMG